MRVVREDKSGSIVIRFDKKPVFCPTYSISTIKHARETTFTAVCIFDFTIIRRNFSEKIDLCLVASEFFFAKEITIESKFKQTNDFYSMERKFLFSEFVLEVFFNF